MSLKIIVPALIFLFSALSNQCFSLQTRDSTSSDTIWHKASLSGTIIDIEKEERVVVLRGTDSLLYSLHADTAIHLDQLTSGDMVKVEYFQPFLLDAGVPTWEERENPDQFIDGAVSPPEGTNPGIEGLTQVKAVVTVEQIDTGKSTIIVRSNSGERFLLYVPEKQLFQQLSSGKEVTIVYTKGLAVSVNKRKIS